MPDPVLNIPFEGIAPFFLFIIGVPAFVLQFLSPEERRVVLRWRFWLEIGITVLAAGAVVAGAIALQIRINPKNDDLWIWGYMYLVLFAISGLAAYRVSNHYGRREKIIKSLRMRAGRKLKRPRTDGRLDEAALEDLVSLGRQCESGQEQELVLQALDELVARICESAEYQADQLEMVIEETVNLLVSRPQPEDYQSFHTAVLLLQRIVTCTTPVAALADQLTAVKALSVLCQTMLAQVRFSIGVDSILEEYKETLYLAWLNHKALVTDVTQALYDTGTVALQNRRPLYAVAAFRKLSVIVNETSPLPSEARTDMLGLLAYFWDAKARSSSRLFAKKSLASLNLNGEALQTAVDSAISHCRTTMEFETADKLAAMKKELEKETS